MYNKIINSIKEGTFIIKVKHKIKLVISNLLRYFVETGVKVKNNKVMFLTYQGSYSCNPKAVCNEFIKRNLDYELVWVIRDEDTKNLDQYPKELKIVKRNSLKFYREAASCKFFIDNANNFEYLNMKKKKEQYLFQPWHGSLGFKKLDASSVKNTKWVKKALLLDSVTDYCIANSKFEIDVFKTSYWPNTKMLKYGHPRNDILFNLNGEWEYYSKKIRKMYNIDKDTKIALYAPTYRDNFTFDSYNLDYSKLKNALEKRFGGKWCILVRFHFKLKYAKIPKKYIKDVINVTDYIDMQELLCACDIGITDYSSWICDFVLTKKPGFLFTLDILDYLDERGLYYPLETSPFPVCKNNDELYKNILNFDLDKYEKDVIEFLIDKECYEDGNASKRVVDKIISLTNK